MAYFAFQTPYLYSGGNYLSVASYGSLVAAFTSALTETLAKDKVLPSYVVSQAFKNILFAMWLLPYVVVFADMANVFHLFMWAIGHRRHCGRFLPHKHDPDPVADAELIFKREEKKLDRIKTEFKSEHKRGLFILSTFQSLLPIVRKVVHMAGVNAQHERVHEKKALVASLKKTATATDVKRHKRQLRRGASFVDQLPPIVSPWNDKTDGFATLALAKELEAQLCSMIEAFSNGGIERGGEEGGDGGSGGGGGGDRDGQGRSPTITGNYRPLYWRHFIDAEKAAIKLSQLAFPFTDSCVKKAEHEKGKPGLVRKSFIQRHLLWGKSVTVQLRIMREEMEMIDCRKKRGKFAGVHHPNMSDIRTWREVIVAMIKPHTDFGWHGHSGGMSDAAKALLIRSQTHALEDGDVFVGDEEKKTEFGVHVAGGPIEMSQLKGDHPGHGSILRHVAKHLQSDPEVVLEAVRRDRGEIMHASEELKGDKVFVLSAIEVGSGSGGSGRSSGGVDANAVVFRDADGEVEAHV